MDQLRAQRAAKEDERRKRLREAYEQKKAEEKAAWQAEVKVREERKKKGRETEWD